MSRTRIIPAAGVLLVLLSAAALFAGQVTFARYPALNPAGNEIAFSFQGDIWVSDVTGSNPRRLTIHKGYEMSPRWSIDGSYIAFSGNRFGNNDVFVIPSNGGESKRLTYHSSGDIVTDWSSKFGIVFSTSRTFRQIEREQGIYAVKKSGGTPVRILDEVGSSAVVSPDGRYIAFEKGECRVAREQYKGPANRDIWIFDTKDKTFHQITKEDYQDILPRWADSRTLYFLSADKEKYNIRKVAVNEKAEASPKEEITNFSDDGIRYFDVCGKGDIIVFERKTGLYSCSLKGENISEIPVNIGADYRFDPVEHKTFTNKINDYSVSPNGKYSAFEIHGEIFITENSKEKKQTINISNSPWRDQSPVWLNDTTLAFVSDRNKQYDIYFVRSADKKVSDLFKTLKREITRVTNTKEDESALVVSPDSKKLAFLRGRGQLIVADIDKENKLSNQIVLLDGWATPGSVVWSPDSKWLAYSIDDLDFNSEIYIQAANNSVKPVNVSMHPRGDTNPVWSPDGSKLAFCSERNNRDSDVWFVWLKKSDWEKTPQDWEDDADKDDTSKKGKDSKKKKIVMPVKIDFNRIYDRLVQVTTFPGDEYNIAISKDGKTFYFTGTSPSGKGSDLFKVKWNRKDLKQITKGGQNPGAVLLSNSGKFLYMLKKGRLSRIKTDSDKSENISFLAKMDINHRAEKEQIFEEAWRTLYHGFYDPNFHGQNFVSLKKKYKPWAIETSTKHDFRDIFNIMIGQLNASHMGLYGGDMAKTQRESTGFLGVAIKPVKKGVVVKRVIPDSPADRTASKLYPGDIIKSVDGQPVSDKINFYSLLTNLAGKKVLLNVTDKNGSEREVVIRPVRSLRNLLYREWVAQRRTLTEKLSGGRLGYLHIQGMNMPSFERFERDFTAAASGKEGIVIDVRYNGGGWTTDYLMAVLNVKQHAYTIPRGAVKNLKKEHSKFRDFYPFAERLPFYPWMKPSIAMCNEASYSNAEIFSHAYKTLGIGKLVGKPTFGAVISTGGLGLIDGSFVRLPFRGWYVKATDKNMEHGPAVPDIIVANPPGSKAAGRDPQLEAAVKELLKEIDQKK